MPVGSNAPSIAEVSSRLLPAQLWQVAMVGFGISVVLLDTSVNIAFPAMTEAFAIGIGDIQWVVICYVLTYSSLMLGFGRISDAIGHASIFRVGLAVSSVGFLLCATAPNYPWLLVFRAVQGIGAALVLCCGVALTTSIFGEARRVRALGAYTSILALGTALGPLLGGVLVQHWGWPAVYWFRAPIALIALLCFRTPLSAPPSTSRERFDIVGAALLALALIGLVLAFNRISTVLALPLLLVAVLAGYGFIRQERRFPQPIIDIGLFRQPGFAVINTASTITNFAAFSVFLLTPYYLTRFTGFSLTANGAVLATGAVGLMAASQIGSRLLERWPAQWLVVAGAITSGCGLFWIGTWPATPALPMLLGALLVQGLGLGMFQLAYTDVITAAMPVANRGVAGSLTTLTRTVGVVSAASLVLLLFHHLDPAADFLTAFQGTFKLVAMLPLAMAGWLAASHLRRSM